jgi:hypothetical protein
MAVAARTGSAHGVGMEERPALRFSLRCESGRWPCLPGLNTRAIIFNAAPLAVSRGRPDWPVRHAPDGPVHRDITASCASTGCGAVTLTASRRPRRHATVRGVAVIAPACRHTSRQPSAPPFEKYGVEKPARKNPQTLLKWQGILALRFSTGLFLKL